MIETVTITHHTTKPEYDWEVVIPEGPTVLLPENRFAQALELLGVKPDDGIAAEFRALQNGGSRSVNAEISEGMTRELVALGVKSVGGPTS
jgi:hypothetical protein